MTGTPGFTIFRQFPYLSALEHGAFVFAGLLVYVLVTRIGHQRRHPSAAIGWVLGIALVPYLGVPLFLLLGARKLTRPVHVAPGHRPAAGTSPGPPWAVELAASMNLQEPSWNAGAHFHERGREAHAAQMQGIAQARHSVDLCTFILANDEIGNAVAAALAAGAARGVRVRLLLDAIGSMRASRRHLHGLREAGVEVRWFMPLLHNPLRGRTNLRNHRKLLITDGERMWSGGRNQADEYFLDRPGRSAWVDLTFEVCGPLAQQAHHVFERDWTVSTGLRRGERLPSLHTADAPHGDVATQLVPSGPDHADDTVYALLLAGAWQARKRILAATPYFVPDDALMSAWCMACRRGVQLTLLLPGRSNHHLADLARERSLRSLAEAGARIYLYPTMLHAKVVVIDEAVALCGSVNLDGRSLFLNYEIMTAFYSRAQIDWLSRWLARHVMAAHPYQARRPSWSRDVLEGVVRAVGFQL